MSLLVTQDLQDAYDLDAPIHRQARAEQRDRRTVTFAFLSRVAFNIRSVASSSKVPLLFYFGPTCD